MTKLPEDFGELLTATVSAALERMAFMVGEPTDEISGAIHHSSCIAQQVSGVPYKVCIRATDGALQELLNGLIDCETFDDAEAQLAANELANVLGGEVLRLLGGDRSPSKLGLPEEGATSEGSEETVRCVLDFMGETLEVSVGVLETAA